MEKPDDQSIKMTATIPKDLHRQIRIYAFENEIRVKEIVTEALRNYLAERQQRPYRQKGSLATRS
ncbi:MAG: hypothetical protein WCA21_15495 [Terracidiphilus sp.]